jgi:hypothetical protein
MITEEAVEELVYLYCNTTGLREEVTELDADRGIRVRHPKTNPGRGPGPPYAERERRHDE